MLFTKEELQLLSELLTIEQSKAATKGNETNVEKYEILKRKIRMILKGN